jgi:hypothetical protein
MQPEEVKMQIMKDEHFLDKMRQMGEKWCHYPLIADAIRDAQERLEANIRKLENGYEKY